MVKKKVSKKSKSRRVSKKKVSKPIKTKSKNSSISKKEFETFQFGVQRLKELSSELDSLDTRGFSRDVTLIKSKLKTVSEIPNIERLMKNLKLKINKKYKPRRKTNTTTKKLSKNLEDIKKDLDSIKRKKALSVQDLKEEFKTIKKLNKKGFVDSGVDVLVDTNFNDFLISVKRALSDRLKNKELAMDETLKEDLDKRELKYKRKNKVLIDNFERDKKKIEDLYKRKYNQKVESELHKEISKNFTKKLNEEFHKHKVQLGKKYKQQLIKHYQDSFEKKKMQLEKEMNQRKERFESYKEEERRKMRMNILNKLHKQFVEDFAKKENVLRRQLKLEYDSKLKKQVQDHEQEMKQKKLDLELEMQKKIKQLLN